MSKRETLTNIYNHALQAVLADVMMKNNVKIGKKNLKIHDIKYPLKYINNLYLFTVGKAGLGMAKACETILGSRIYGGVAISHQKGVCEYVEHYQSTHPLVSKKSIEGAEKLMNVMQSMKEDDFFIFCLSGGASAMIEQPIEGLSLEDFQTISSSLLGSGIDITALNSVRKAISQIKGGKLANLTRANGVVLVLSDVIEDDLNTIGSAPMMHHRFPHHVIGNNTIALKEAKRYMESKVQKVKIVTTTLNRTSQEATKYITQKIQKYNKKHDSFCLLFGGETTTEVKGAGKGGRNQELALRLLQKGVISDNISILVAGSDGIDGNSPATGAFLTADIYEKIEAEGLDPKVYLEKSDSYTFFKTLGYDFTIGATGTNVMDFIIVLKQ